MTDTVTNAVRRLTELGVGRLEDFEVLLVMSRQPDQEWHPAQVSTSSTIPLPTAEEALARLAKRGVLELGQADPTGFRLGARVDAAQLAELRKEYERDRARVVTTFFTCNLDSLRSFASAFRIRKS